jgi:uncharacterized membrane protein YeaQ/YmgE (transglycosylase-associated protein family)
VGFLDWLIMLGGVAGFFGTLLRVKMFYDPERMERYVTRYGEGRVRAVVAMAYFVFAVLGAVLLYVNQPVQ